MLKDELRDGIFKGIPVVDFKQRYLDESQYDEMRKLYGECLDINDRLAESDTRSGDRLLASKVAHLYTTLLRSARIPVGAYDYQTLFYDCTTYGRLRIVIMTTDNPDIRRVFMNLFCFGSTYVSTNNPNAILFGLIAIALGAHVERVAMYQGSDSMYRFYVNEKPTQPNITADVLYKRY